MGEEAKKNRYLGNKLYFEIEGEAIVKPDKTIVLDKPSKKEDSDYMYNSIRLTIRTGENRIATTEAMAGYSQTKGGTIYTKSKDNEQMEVDFADRNNLSVIENVRSNEFVRAGIIKDEKDELIIKQFLSEYDLIEYLDEHLEDGMIVKVKGEIKVEKYKGKINLKKKIKSIYLSDKKADDFHATFTGDIVLTSDSLETKRVSKDNEYDIFARIFTWNKEYQKFTPQTYRFVINGSVDGKAEKFVNRYFTTDKDEVVKIGVVGSIYEGFEEIELTIDDLEKETKELVEDGYLDLETAMRDIRSYGNKIETYTIQRPKVEKNLETGKITAVIDRELYTVKDLILDSDDEDDNDGADSTSDDELLSML